MNCPNASQWDLLALEVLEPAPAEALQAHAASCANCHARWEQARRAHVQRMRAYESFDRGHDMLREQLMAQLPADAPPHHGGDRILRIWGRLGGLSVMPKQKLVRRAVAVLVPAACVLIAVGVLLSPGVQRSAFAAAVDQFRHAHTIVCRLSMPEGMEFQGVHLEADGKLYISDVYGSYSTMSVNGMDVTRHYAPPVGPMTVIQPITRTYMELDLSQIAFTEMTEQTPAAFVSALTQLADDSAQELPAAAGTDAGLVGYRIPGEKLGFATAGQSPAAYAELWIERASGLPARFLLSMPMPGQEQPFKLVYDEFAWDTPLDARLFTPDIPEDYVKLDARLARPTEEALLNALERIAALTGGRYPTRFDSISVLAELHGMLTARSMAQLDELGQAGITQLGLEIGSGAMYYMKLVRDGAAPEYFGETVTSADGDQVLMRWKLPDGGTRVIYGDLRVETLGG